jgi:uncharacterized protein (DUF1800 family)
MATLQRREFLQLAGLVAAGATLQACAPLYRRLAGPPGAIEGWPLAAIDGNFVALNRLTFGARAQDRQTAAEVGLANWIEEQLSPEGINDMPAMWRARHLDAIQLDADALEGWEKEDVVHQLKQNTLLRQVYGERQLYEVMVEFWTDHFNVSIEKGDCWFLKVVDDHEVIRKHAMGNFRELLWASSHSPAMLIYLDNQANDKDHPNENYARELMELHTLGVDGGYTQEDVMEVARCLTGWTVKQHFWRGQFAFDPGMHDDEPKTVLGQMITLNGIGEGEQVLDKLASHPSTAQYVSTKLVRRFITDKPEKDAPQLVAQAAQAFLQTGGDIRAVLRVILLDGLANPNLAIPPKFKRPANFIASALRMLAADTGAQSPVYETLSAMGQPAFEWPTPDGPPDTSDAWSNNLMPRWQFALALARGELPGTQINLGELYQRSGAGAPDAFIDRLSSLLIGIPFPANKKGELLQALSRVDSGSEADFGAILVAGLVASPAFQWR